MPAYRDLLLSLMALCALGGCAHQPKTPGQEVAQIQPTYPQRVLARLEQAEEAKVHQVRYNPTSCGCPAHEVQLAGVWHRVSLEVDEPDDEVLLSLKQAEEAARAQGQPGTHALQGRLGSELTTCGRGAIVVRLRPTAYGAPAVDEEPEEDATSEDARESPGVQD